MDLNPPAGIVKWYNTPLGERGRNSFKAQLTGKDYPGASRITSYVKLSDKEADEVIENIKKDSEGIPIFDEENAPDKREEYQRWLVARYLTKTREEGFEERKKEGVKELEDELGPEGLDQLLGLIREEAKVAVGAGGGGGGGSGPTSTGSAPPSQSSSALAVVPKKPQDLVEEEINSQILSILGLEDVFDLTYEEYASLLKEAAVKGRMANSQMTTESIELVTNELKRVRGKTGRFKVKQKKINIDKVINRKSPSAQKVQLDPSKLLPPGMSQDEVGSTTNGKIIKFLKEDLGEQLDNIKDKLDELLSTLRDEASFEKKEKEKKRRKSEKEKKSKRESELESTGKKANKIFEKVSKPFVSFFDRIKQFFLSILIGSALNFLLSVFKNPSIILNPLKNLANGVVGFLNNIISFLWNFFVSPINFVINSINSGISGLISQINNAIGLIPGTKPISSPQIPTIPGPPQIPTPFPVQQQTGGGQVVNHVQQQTGGGQVVNHVQQQTGGGQVVNVGDISFEGGGQIKKNSGIKISGFGKDDRLIAAQDGEVMMSNKAGDFWGRDTLLTMNAMGGGTNQPKFGKLGIQPMQGGGRVGTLFPHMDAATASYAGGAHVIGQGQFANVLASIISQSAQKNKIGRLPGTGSNAVNRDLKSLRVANSGGSPSALAEFSTLKQAVDQYKSPVGFANSNYMSEFIRGLRSSLDGAPLVIGMDHSRKKIPNSPTDSRTTQAAASGASYGGYTERDFTDAIARRIKQEIVNTTIIRPEDYKNYEQYDKALKNAITKAKMGQTAPKAPNVPLPNARPSIVPLPIPMGNGRSRSSVPTSSAAPNQAEVPSFPSEDPNNMTTMVVKAIYNVVG